jgi:2',3'-cyclic-nucleotide 2'-phosphodiesterase (5'-nucleotidase family)
MVNRLPDGLGCAPFRQALLVISVAIAALLAGEPTGGVRSAPGATARPSERGARSSSLDLILSASTLGELLPCGECHIAAGGLPRRAGMIQACRDTADFVLVADGGDLLLPGGADPQVEHFLVGLLARIGYSVLGVGESELGRGIPYLRELVADHEGLEWVSANIVDTRTGEPVFAPFVLEQAGSHVVGVTSVLEPALWTASSGGAVAVEPVVETMARVVARMRRECDLIVCLAHVRYLALAELLESVEGIDIAVASHQPRLENYPKRIGHTQQVYFAGSRGRFQNWARVVFTADGPVLDRGRIYHLLDHMPEDSTISREILNFLGTDEPPGPGTFEGHPR